MANAKDDDKYMDNIASFSNRETIKEEAGRWLVRLDQGELGVEEVLEFQEWVKRSDYHRLYLEKLARNWDSMSLLQELAELFPLPHSESASHEALPNEKALTNEKPQPDPGTKAHKHSRSGFSSFTLSLRTLVLTGSAIAASLVLLVLVDFNPIIPDLATDIGEQTVYQLNDGSTMILNTNSQVNIDYSGDRRVIHLLKGEASFDVAKNPNRPFVVYAGTGMVWAVGTAFNVRYTSQMVDVTVTEGVVKVYTEIDADEPALSLDAEYADATTDTVLIEREAIVDAGQSIQYREVIQAHELAVASVLEQKLAWQRGALVFKGETLEQALIEIARYTDKELIIADPSIKDIQIGGHYKTNDIDGLLATLSRGFGIDVNMISDDRVYLSSKK